MLTTFRYSLLQRRVAIVGWGIGLAALGRVVDKYKRALKHFCILVYEVVNRSQGSVRVLVRVLGHKPIKGVQDNYLEPARLY